jgi:hypothetical protein
VTTQTSSRDDAAAIDLIDAFCDAVPRRLARAEAHGPLMLFVSGEEGAGGGWGPYYARPRRGTQETITAAHVREVRARQRQLGVPESFEWIAQTVPGLARTATAAGLDVSAHPLMISQTPVPELELAAGFTVREVPPDEPDLARVVAVPSVAFGHPGTSPGSPGPAERDKLAAERDPASLERLRHLLASGHSVLAAVTARLAALAFGRGAHTVFLSASDDAVARVYAGIGFRRIGTAMIAEPV